MSNKHLFQAPDGLVLKSIRGTISSNLSLSLMPNERVVFSTLHNYDNVAIISGGGSGHEPAYSGYVGKNMLAAAVAGDIFASPSVRQIQAAIKAVPSNKGTILVILNYTGDRLHFGLACEKANASGEHSGKVAVLACGDDVSLGKENNRVGRRGLAGHVIGRRMYVWASRAS
jgi:dihydroxyacetone kinase